MIKELQELEKFLGKLELRITSNPISDQRRNESNGPRPERPEFNKN